jgi:hypothetical protein
LILNGLSINGFNSELNTGIVYASISIGEIINSTFTNSRNMNLKSNLNAYRFGLGDKNRTLVAGTILKSKSNDNFNSTGQILNINNEVLGIELKHTYESLNFQIEFAKSNNRYSESESIGLINLLNNTKRTNAYHANLKYDFSSIKLNLLTKISYVDPYFSSVGNPFLIRDVFKYDIALSKAFYKNIIRTNIGYNYLRTNLSNTNILTTSTRILNFRLDIKFKKLPSLSLTYQPTEQLQINHSTKEIYTNKLDVLILQANYPIIISNTISSNTTLSLSNFNNSFVTDTSTLERQVGITLQQFLTINHIRLSTVFSYTNFSSIDGQINQSIGIELIKELFKSLSTSAAYDYSYDKFLQSRESYTAGFNYLFKYNVQLSFRYHFSTGNNPVYSNINLVKMSITKRF